MTIAEGGGRRAVSKKLQEIYLPALKANWMLWPVVQILNFRVVPLQFQIVSFNCQYHLTRHLLNENAALCLQHWNNLDSILVIDKLLGGSFVI